MKDFNIIVTGVGGQGALTLGLFIAEAAAKQGYDVRTTEIHGLAQRGGPIPVHIRIGKDLNSALIMESKADLVISLEPLEALRSAVYGSTERTAFLIDDAPMVPLTASMYNEHYPSNEEVKSILLKEFAKSVEFVNASEVALKEVGNVISSNVYMLGVALGKGLLPIEKEHVLAALSEKKFFEANRKMLELGMQAKQAHV